jgi:hypothetical protein
MTVPGYPYATLAILSVGTLLFGSELHVHLDLLHDVYGG